MTAYFVTSSNSFPANLDVGKIENYAISLVPIFSEKTIPTRSFVTAENARMCPNVTAEGMAMSAPAFQIPTLQVLPSIEALCAFVNLLL